MSLLTTHHSPFIMTIQEATKQLTTDLKTIYEKEEAIAISDWVMEYITGSKRVERMLYKNSPISSEEESQLVQCIERLLRYEPVQYVLNEVWFCGLKFYIDKNVLIPRPETEELVEWVIEEVRSTKSEVRGQKSDIRHPTSDINIFDVGSGSGCIPIALNRKLQKAEVWSCDANEAALQVAKKNAETLGADVHFLLLDFLNEEKREQLPSFDIIISNPPYIPEKDKRQMKPNVINYEPHTALFVPDNDPLVFYKAIAEFGREHLNTGGAIYVEINENMGKSVSILFNSHGYKTEIKKDMQGKDRMIKAEF